MSIDTGACEESSCDVDGYLRSLVVDGCMQRHSYAAGSWSRLERNQSDADEMLTFFQKRVSTLLPLSNWSSSVNASTSEQQPQLPIFVMHHPAYRERHRWMRLQLSAISALDVTWVLCANREDVDSLTPAASACLFQGAVQPSNGSRSIALKHLLAYQQLRLRNISEALVLEDDVMLPLDLWFVLQAPWARRPPDTDLFWLGGGRIFNFDEHRFPQTSYCGLKYNDRRRLFTYCVMNRSNWWTQYKTSEPRFITSASYVISRKGAASMQGWPVIGPSDKAISDGQYVCRRRFWGAASTCHKDAGTCRLGAQYGTSRWVIQTHEVREANGTQVLKHWVV